MILKHPTYKDSDKPDCFDFASGGLYQLSNGRIINVPVGFTTDFASIPRLFWNIYPPHWYAYRHPAIVHDYLYMEQDIITSRKFADMEFKRMLLSFGVSRFTAWLFWACVRLGGAKRWNNYKMIKNEKGTKL